MSHKGFEHIYQVVQKIPKGKVATYGRVAKLVGVHPRVVGRAMNKNPNPIVVPCHRVVGVNGHLIGYALGLVKKRELLLGEGVEFKGEMHIDLTKSLWIP